MSVIPLPPEASFDQLRKQAKELRQAVAAGQPAALAEVAERHPGGKTALAGPFPLHAAQLLVARRYGFASWPLLKQHIKVLERYTRFPNRLDRSGSGDLAEEFLSAACLCYEDDQPGRWQQAREVLAAHPEITRGNVFVAAAAPDVAELRRILAADPGAARREGGPYRWEPLCYLAYARHDPGIGEAEVLTAARLLLGAGADPNAGYLWHGMPIPFTVLTGVFGEGELGPERQPPHAHALALAKLLLAAGADPNDEQALYNRMFTPGNDHLELLFEFGLGSGDGGPWRERLGEQLRRPPRPALRRAPMGDRARHAGPGQAALRPWRRHHGPFSDGRTPAAFADVSGHPEIATYLVGRGAAQPVLAHVDEFAAAALAGDLATTTELLARRPGLLREVSRAHPGLVVAAVELGRPDSVELLVTAGFHPDGSGRTGAPGGVSWQTPLHAAAESGQVGLVRLLLALGADPGIRDKRFSGTPLDWARHFGQDAVADLLEPVTPAEPVTPLSQ